MNLLPNFLDIVYCDRIPNQQVKKTTTSKMNTQIANDANNRSLPPQISYKSYMMIGETPTDISDYLKLDINMQQCEKYRKTVSIYVKLFRTGSTEALLELITLNNRIIKK